MFCHISVIKDDCCVDVVAYECFFLPEHLQVSGGGQTESPALSSLPSLAFSTFRFLP